MPTEDDARTLLAKAAATIEVDETAPLTLTGLPEPHARRWPVLAAAAAVVVAIGGGYLVAQPLGNDDGRQPKPAPASQDDPTGSPDRLMPGVIGLTQEEATRLLEGRGLTVRVREQPDGCNQAGIVTGSTPVVGSTLLVGGERVTIDVIAPQQVIDCVGEVPWDRIWELVRYARGVEPAPEHIDESGVPSDAVDTLDEMVTQSWAGSVPSLAAQWSYDVPCGNPAINKWDLRIWVQTTPNGSSACSGTSLLINLNRDGISEVEVDNVGGGVITTDELEASLNRLASARLFVQWARGEGPAPEFADRVRVMFFGGGAFGSTGWVNDPADRRQYSGCSGLGFPDCPVDPVAMIYRYDGRVAISAGRSVCAGGGAVPKRFADADQDAVSLSEPPPCSALVELWIDEDGVIYGVNQAGELS